jgi:hypothetical protein
MKIQNLLPYDSNTPELKDLFVDFNNGKFYVNIPIVNVPNKIVATGKTYILLNQEKKPLYFLIKLIDVFYMADFNAICFLVDDAENQSRMMPVYYITTGELKPFKWELRVINNDMMKTIEDEIVRQYCKCGKKQQSNEDDLLEFF